MLNFTFHNPVRMVFGKGQISALQGLTEGRRRILLLYGGGSIKRNGIYAQVLAALKGRDVLEFGGIRPNPDYDTLLEAARLCREQEVDFLLAVGGGSVVDGAKFIAAAAPYPGEDPWDMVTGKVAVPEALPFGVVLTLAATGSEMNEFSVVSRAEPKAKLAFGSEKLYPRFSILDPETTYELPERQIINGIVDPFVHVTEQYLTREVQTPLQDRMACSILSTLIEEGPKALRDPRNYDARANLMWCATLALNGLIGAGAVQDWATHAIGHELTSSFGLDHAQTLAIILPVLLRHQLRSKSSKLAQYGRNVWGLTAGSEEELALAAIERTESFFRSLGMLTKLSEYGLDRLPVEALAQRIVEAKGGPLGENRDIGQAEIAAILEDA